MISAARSRQAARSAGETGAHSVAPIAASFAIFATAAGHDNVGKLSETLKWGEPAYLTGETGSGSTIRLGRLKDSEHAAILFNCKTTLVDTFRERFPDRFEYRQTRALLLPVSGALPKQELTVCLSLALTYHLDRRRKH